MNLDSAEKVILIGLNHKDNKVPFESLMEELKGLTEAAGGKVIAVLTQRQDRPHPATYIGKGKLNELSRLVEELEPDTVIFNGELSPVQIRNLEEKLEVKIIDRTMLILDIFRRRAKSREGMLQVELAALEYRLPRLTGMGKKLSRLGGGIGTRGAGEQKLELDRRYIRKRIQEIKRQMQKVEKTRLLHRKQRQRAGLKTVSMVGYTNAGKSSLFNTLCKMAHSSGNEQVDADNRLFQTLDTTTRKIKLPDKQEILITDTVGFIQDLPHSLIAAFHSTLEEAVQSDLLLHIVDISDPNYLEKIKVVEDVLEELGASKEQVINVFNKVDLLTVKPEAQGINYTSAYTGEGISLLMKKIAAKVNY